MRSARAEDSALLAARAAQLARPLDEHRGQDALEFLLVVVGGQQLAVPLHEVREVRPPGRLAQMPGGTGVLTGIVAGHGDVLPVGSLAALLELAGSAAPDAQWVVAVEDGPAPLGLLVDAAIDIVIAERRDLNAPSGAGLISALLPDGTAVLDIQALRRDPRLSFTPGEPTREPSWQAR